MERLREKGCERSYKLHWESDDVRELIYVVSLSAQSAPRSPRVRLCWLETR